MLTNLKLTASGFQVQDLEPLQLPDVLADRPVVCLGKWTGEARGTLTLSGMSGAGPWSQTFAVGKVKDRNHAALPRLWARQRIQALADYDQFGQDEGRKAEVTRLGLAYSLLTAHTSFVAVDTLVRHAGGPSTTVTQPLPLPEGVADTAVGGVPGGVVGGLVGAHRVAAPPPAMVAKHALQETDPSARLEQVKTTPSLRIRAFSGITGTSDPRSLRRELETRLLEPALAAALVDLPAGTTLELKVDATGKVLVATFDRSFPGAARAKILLETWCLRRWTGGLAGSLELTLGWGL